MQDANAVISNGVATNFSLQFTGLTELSSQVFVPAHSVTSFTTYYQTSKHYWHVAIADSSFGLIEWEGNNGTDLMLAGHRIHLPFSAPSIAWTSAGLSIALVILAILARRRWRRNRAAH